MRGVTGRVAAGAGVAVALLAVSGPTVDARGASAAKTRVVYMNDRIGCANEFERLVCNGFLRAARRTGVDGRIITPGVREDLVVTLDRMAAQGWDLTIAFGFAYPEALGVAAKRHPRARFAILDRTRREVPGRPRNVHGVVFRTSEAAFLAGYLAARMEQRRPGPDVVGLVGGIPIDPVRDFVLGFRAGARHAVPGIRVLVDYSYDFTDRSKCAALARRQIARGAGVLFNVAAVCGLGTMRAARDGRVWAVGVDEDQSFLGRHVLTSVLKDFGAGFEALLRRLKAGRLQAGRDVVVTLRDDAVGLGRISRAVPASLRADLDRLERRIRTGAVRVPGVHPGAG